MQHFLLNRFKYLLSFIIVISMVSFISCSSDDEESNNIMNQDDEDPLPTTQVSISGLLFKPQNITVNVADTVTWTNMDGVTHRIVWDTGGFPTSQNLATSETYQIIPMTTGTFLYHCGIHLSMTGSVIVN